MDPANVQGIDPNDTHYFERLAALKMLREYMFYGKPETYAYTDIAEDLPGSAKPIGSFFKNTLPSAAIISSDPAERKKQIIAAIERIKQSKKSENGVGKDMLENALTMGKSSLLPSVILSALPGLMGLRGFRGVDKLGKKVWQLPFSSKPIRHLLGGGPSRGSKLYRNKFLKETFSDAASNVGFSAVSGALYPLLSNKLDVSDKALQEAQKIMEEQPYLTSLPTSELLSVIKQRRAENPSQPLDKMRNMTIGAGLGVAAGGVGALLPSASRLLLGGLTLGRFKPRGGYFKGLGRDLKLNAGMSGAMGLFSGMTTKNIVEDEAKLVEETKAEQKLKNTDQQDVQQAAVPYQA